MFRNTQIYCKVKEVSTGKEDEHVRSISLVLEGRYLGDTGKG